MHDTEFTVKKCLLLDESSVTVPLDFAAEN
jgi:hypothetical protein